MSVNVILGFYEYFALKSYFFLIHVIKPVEDRCGGKFYQIFANKMHFVGINTPGGPSNLSVMVTPVPLPKDGEVLIKVQAAGVNGADLREREGRYPVPAGAPDIMGLEVAGEIIATGKYCSRFKPGDLVCALLIGGGYAEYAIAPEGQCMTIPAGVSVVDAAGLPEVFCTVWTNVMDRCQLKPGETLLVQGGTSGIICRH